MMPRGWRTGAKIIHAVTLPRNMLQHTWSPVMAPAAMNMGSQENITVRPIHAGPNTRWLRAATHVPIMNGASCALTTTSPSVQNLLTTASRPAQPSPRADRIPDSPTEWSARSVSAAAMPLGKRRCSTLIICRFMGIAMVTPSTERQNTHASIVGSDMVLLLMSM
jgi:hypothetical protein